MPWGRGIDELPTVLFRLAHSAAFASGAACAWIALERKRTLLGLDGEVSVR